MPIFLENFSPILCEKLCTRSPLALITPTSQRRSAQQRTTMVGEISWIVFTIRVLVKKHISGPRPSFAPFCRRPCSACKNYFFNT